MRMRAGVLCSVVAAVVVVGCGSSDATVPSVGAAFEPSAIRHAEQQIETQIGKSRVTDFQVSAEGVEVQYIVNGTAQSVGWLYATHRLTNEAFGDVRTLGSADRPRPMTFPVNPTIPSKIIQQIRARMNDHHLAIKVLDGGAGSWTIVAQPFQLFRASPEGRLN